MSSSYNNFATSMLPWCAPRLLHPVVVVETSDAVESAALKNGVDFVQLLRPFSETKRQPTTLNGYTTTTSTIGSSRTATTTGAASPSPRALPSNRLASSSDGSGGRLPGASTFGIPFGVRLTRASCVKPLGSYLVGVTEELLRQLMMASPPYSASPSATGTADRPGELLDAVLQRALLYSTDTASRCSPPPQEEEPSPRQPYHFASWPRRTRRTTPRGSADDACAAGSSSGGTGGPRPRPQYVAAPRQPSGKRMSSSGSPVGSPRGIPAPSPFTSAANHNGTAAAPNTEEPRSSSPALSEMDILLQSTLPPWYPAFLKAFYALVRGSHVDTLDHPVGILYVVSTREGLTAAAEGGGGAECPSLPSQWKTVVLGAIRRELERQSHNIEQKVFQDAPMISRDVHVYFLLVHDDDHFRTSSTAALPPLSPSDIGDILRECQSMTATLPMMKNASRFSSSTAVGPRSTGDCWSLLTLNSADSPMARFTPGSRDRVGDGGPLDPMRWVHANPAYLDVPSEEALDGIAASVAVEMGAASQRGNVVAGPPTAGVRVGHQPSTTTTDRNSAAAYRGNVNVTSTSSRSAITGAQQDSVPAVRVVPAPQLFHTFFISFPWRRRVVRTDCGTWVMEDPEEHRDSRTPALKKTMVQYTASYLNEENVMDMENFMYTYTFHHLMRFMEQQVSKLSAEIQQRRTTTLGKVAAWFKSEQAKPKPDAVPVVPSSSAMQRQRSMGFFGYPQQRSGEAVIRFRETAIEMQMRRCADLCLFLHDFETAQTQFKICRDELLESVAQSRVLVQPLLGGVQEALSLCQLFLQQTPHVLPAAATAYSPSTTAASLFPSVRVGTTPANNASSSMALLPCSDSTGIVADSTINPKCSGGVCRLEVALSDYLRASCASGGEEALKPYVVRTSLFLFEMCRTQGPPRMERAASVLLTLLGTGIPQSLSHVWNAALHQLLAGVFLCRNPPFPVLDTARLMAATPHDLLELYTHQYALTHPGKTDGPSKEGGRQWAVQSFLRRFVYHLHQAGSHWFVESTQRPSAAHAALYCYRRLFVCCKDLLHDEELEQGSNLLRTTFSSRGEGESGAADTPWEDEWVLEDDVDHDSGEDEIGSGHSFGSMRSSKLVRASATTTPMTGTLIKSGVVVSSRAPQQRHRLQQQRSGWRGMLDDIVGKLVYLLLPHLQRSQRARHPLAVRGTTTAFEEPSELPPSGCSASSRRRRSPPGVEGVAPELDQRQRQQEAEALAVLTFALAHNIRGHLDQGEREKVYKDIRLLFELQQRCQLTPPCSPAADPTAFPSSPTLSTGQFISGYMMLPLVDPDSLRIHLEYYRLDRLSRHATQEAKAAAGSLLEKEWGLSETQLRKHYQQQPQAPLPGSMERSVGGLPHRSGAGSAFPSTLSLWSVHKENRRPTPPHLAAGCLPPFFFPPYVGDASSLRVGFPEARRQMMERMKQNNHHVRTLSANGPHPGSSIADIGSDVTAFHSRFASLEPGSPLGRPIGEGYASPAAPLLFTVPQEQCIWLSLSMLNPLEVPLVITDLCLVYIVEDEGEIVLPSSTTKAPAHWGEEEEEEDGGSAGTPPRTAPVPPGVRVEHQTRPSRRRVSPHEVPHADHRSAGSSSSATTTTVIEIPASQSKLLRVPFCTSQLPCGPVQVIGLSWKLLLPDTQDAEERAATSPPSGVEGRYYFATAMRGGGPPPGSTDTPSPASATPHQKDATHAGEGSFTSIASLHQQPPPPPDGVAADAPVDRSHRFVPSPASLEPCASSLLYHSFDSAASVLNAPENIRFGITPARAALEASFHPPLPSRLYDGEVFFTKLRLRNLTKPHSLATTWSHRGCTCCPSSGGSPTHHRHREMPSCCSSESLSKGEILTVSPRAAVGGREQHDSFHASLPHLVTTPMKEGGERSASESRWHCPHCRLTPAAIPPSSDSIVGGYARHVTVQLSPHNACLLFLDGFDGQPALQPSTAPPGASSPRQTTFVVADCIAPGETLELSVRLRGRYHSVALAGASAASQQYNWNDVMLLIGYIPSVFPTGHSVATWEEESGGTPASASASTTSHRHANDVLPSHPRSGSGVAHVVYPTGVRHPASKKGGRGGAAPLQSSSIFPLPPHAVVLHRLHRRLRVDPLLSIFATVLPPVGSAVARQTNARDEMALPLAPVVSVTVKNIVSPSVHARLRKRKKVLHWTAVTATHGPQWKVTGFTSAEPLSQPVPAPLPYGAAQSVPLLLQRLPFCDDLSSSPTRSTAAHGHQEPPVPPPLTEECCYPPPAPSPQPWIQPTPAPRVGFDPLGEPLSARRFFLRTSVVDVGRMGGEVVNPNAFAFSMYRDGTLEKNALKESSTARHDRHGAAVYRPGSTAMAQGRHTDEEKRAEALQMERRTYGRCLEPFPPIALTIHWAILEEEEGDCEDREKPSSRRSAAPIRRGRLYHWIDPLGFLAGLPADDVSNPSGAASSLLASSALANPNNNSLRCAKEEETNPMEGESWQLRAARRAQQRAMCEVMMLNAPYGMAYPQPFHNSQQYRGAVAYRVSLRDVPGGENLHNEKAATVSKSAVPLKWSTPSNTKDSSPSASWMSRGDVERMAVGTVEVTIAVSCFSPLPLLVSVHTQPLVAGPFPLFPSLFTEAPSPSTTASDAGTPSSLLCTSSSRPLHQRSNSPAYLYTVEALPSQFSGRTTNDDVVADPQLPLTTVVVMPGDTLHLPVPVRLTVHLRGGGGSSHWLRSPTALQRWQQLRAMLDVNIFELQWRTLVFLPPSAGMHSGMTLPALLNVLCTLAGTEALFRTTEHSNEPPRHCEQVALGEEEQEKESGGEGSCSEASPTLSTARLAAVDSPTLLASTMPPVARGGEEGAVSWSTASEPPHRNAEETPPRPLQHQDSVESVSARLRRPPLIAGTALSSFSTASLASGGVSPSPPPEGSSLHGAASLNAPPLSASAPSSTAHLLAMLVHQHPSEAISGTTPQDGAAGNTGALPCHDSNERRERSCGGEAERRSTMVMVGTALLHRVTPPAFPASQIALIGRQQPVKVAVRIDAPDSLMRINNAQQNPENGSWSPSPLWEERWSAAHRRLSQLCVSWDDARNALEPRPHPADPHTSTSASLGGQPPPPVSSRHADPHQNNWNATTLSPAGVIASLHYPSAAPITVVPSSTSVEEGSAATRWHLPVHGTTPDEGNDRPWPAHPLQKWMADADALSIPLSSTTRRSSGGGGPVLPTNVPHGFHPSEMRLRNGEMRVASDHGQWWKRGQVAWFSTEEAVDGREASIFADITSSSFAAATAGMDGPGEDGSITVKELAACLEHSSHQRHVKKFQLASGYA